MAAPLYYIDLNSPDYAWGNYPSGKLGYLPGVRSISSLYGDLDLCQRVEDLDGRGAFQNGSEILQSLPISLNTSLETLERFTGKTAAENAQNEVSGSLNSVVTSEQKAQPQSDPDTVTLQLTSDRAAANGKLTLTFDTDALALQSVKGLNVQAFAWKESNGTVVLGYADDASLPAGTPVAELTFTRKTGLVSNVTVLWQEQIPDASDEKQIVTIFCRQADCPLQGLHRPEAGYLVSRLSGLRPELRLHEGAPAPPPSIPTAIPPGPPWPRCSTGWLALPRSPAPIRSPT